MLTLHTHTDTYSISSFTIAAGHRLWELNFYPLCPFPPTCVCSLLPASVFAAVSLPFLFSLSPALSQPLFFSLCHFSCAFLCHYSAHVSRLKRRLLLLACVLSACVCVCVPGYVHMCLCVRALLSVLGQSSIFLFTLRFQIQSVLSWEAGGLKRRTLAIWRIVIISS